MDPQTNEPHAPPSKYEDRYVAFVDILGFASIVETSRSVPGHVERLHQALFRLSTKARVGRSGTQQVEATNFSDTVVLSAPIGAEGLLHIFDAISSFTVDLLNMNMLLRGAVVRGSLLHSTDVTFGPALIEAYRLESTVSFHPRVMIDRTVMRDVEEYSNKERRHQFAKFVVTDNHDVPYLSPFAAWHNQTQLAQDDVERLVMLQTIIASGLIETAGSPGICEKYKWIARKLNAFIKQRGLGDRIALIDVD